MREQKAIVAQFDKLATVFERSAQEAETAVSKVKRGKSDAEVKETAGMLKIKTKVKREKSLGAKLRLKAKKNPGAGGKPKKE
jgi:hypothetical protein